MPERLRSNMWSAETLLRGVRTVGQQPSAELLASNDPELLQELKVFGCQNLWWETPPRILVGVAFFILFAGEFISNLGDSPLTRFEFPKKNPAQQIVTKTWIKSW